MAMGNLVLDDTCRRALLAQGTVVGRLLECLRASDKQTVRYAAGALRNVAVEEQGRTQVTASSGALARLEALTSSQDASTARYAAACLKNLNIAASRPSPSLPAASEM